METSGFGRTLTVKPERAIAFEIAHLRELAARLRRPRPDTVAVAVAGSLQTAPPTCWRC